VGPYARPVAWGDRFYRKASEKIEARVGERVELIGIASRSGAMGAFIGGKLGSIALGTPESLGPRDKMHTAGGGDARLPSSFMVALTPTAFYVFKYRKTWTGVKISKQLGSLPREGLQLETSDEGIVKRFRLAGADGSGISFEMNRVSFTTRFADDLAAALS
jgi:hypothetical protein